MKDIRGFARRIFSMNQGKYLLINLALTLILTLSLELMEFKSIPLLIHFIRERTFLFLFNGFMIFATLSVVLLFRKKIFAYALIGGAWFLVGLINGLVLMNRKTPFTAVDLTIVKSILPIARSYLTVAEILLVLLLIILVIVVVFAVLSIVFSILASLAPLIIVMVVVVFLVKLFRDWLN